VAATPVELLYGANQPELTLLDEVVHVQALADEAARVCHDEAEVCANELVYGSFGLSAAAGEGPSCAIVRASGT
jgi:hypothetical protein